MFFESRLQRLVARMRARQPVPLRIKLWSGRDYDLGPDPTVTVTVPKASALRYFVAPDLGALGEAYVEGHIGLEGPVHEVFKVGERLARTANGGGTLAPLKRAVSHSRSKDKQAIGYHYDVSNDFYALWLDRNMVYSCAYFKDDADDLDRAQEQKLDHILRKLALRPGERFLDIGCGWGALIIRAAEKYGARAVGVTLSQNQYDYARARIRSQGLADRCEVRLQDY